MRAKINGVNADVIVLKAASGFSEYRDVVAQTEKLPGVTAAEPFMMLELEIERDHSRHPFVLKGVDPARVARVLTVGEHMNMGSLDALGSRQNGAPPILLGDALASLLGASIGDEVTVRSREGAKEPWMPVVQPTVLRVAGTFHMDFDRYDEQLALAPLTDVQGMRALGDQVLGVELKLNDLAKSEQIAKELETALGGAPYEVQDWYELNQELYTSLGYKRPEAR